jgi:hypothetical protein
METSPPFLQLSPCLTVKPAPHPTLILWRPLCLTDLGEGEVVSYLIEKVVMINIKLE